MRWRGVVAGLVVAAVALMATPGAHARRWLWPQPAAGESRSGSPEIIFTFDDGPHEHSTAPILDTLAKHDIKAVFFWAGWRVRSKRPVGELRRSLLRRAIAEGHMVGNHTINHVHLCVIPADEAIKELDGNTALLEPLTGMPVRFFRAPYGDRCPRLDGMLAERGLAHLHWDMDPIEWQPDAGVDHIRDYLIKEIKGLKDGERAVILLHDTKWTTARALPQVLDWLEQENRRRAAAGRKTIKVLDYADLALEQIPPDVAALVDGAGAWSAALLPDVAARLLAPLDPDPERLVRN